VFRVRGDRCALWSLTPPFRAAYWPDINAVAAELGIPWREKGADAQSRFASALAERTGFGAALSPTKMRFAQNGGEVLRREEFRRGFALVTFLGRCSRQVTLGAIELVAGRLRRGAKINLQFRKWDALGDWASGREQLADVCNYLYLGLKCRGEVTLFSSLLEVPADLWQFTYERASVRVGWVARDLVQCGSAEEFEQLRAGSTAMENLAQLSERGLWPHIVLPVSRENVGALHAIVSGLVEFTRGGSIECIPVPLLAPGLAAEAFVESGAQTGFSADRAGQPPPDAEQYVEALREIYRDPNIPLALIAPQQWVSARASSETPLLGSPAAAGAELAVTPNGDIFAGAGGEGVERWRVGNVLDEAASLRWERLDVLPEILAGACASEPCKSCDWKHRCGGPDASVLFARARLGPDSSGQGRSLFELYCAPRKELFEEIQWDRCESAARSSHRQPRERLELETSCVRFTPVQENQIAGKS
jgi:radical SAM protein with 4Fe4S-binding SPASM domain